MSVQLGRSLNSIEQLISVLQLSVNYFAVNYTELMHWSNEKKIT